MNDFLQISMLQVLPLGKNIGWAIVLIPLLPLAGFLLPGLLGRKHIKNPAGIMGTILLSGSAILSLYTAYGYFFEYGKVEGIYQKNYTIAIYLA